MSLNSEDIAAMLDDCEKRESKLTEWEYRFIQDLWSKGHLTTKQQEKLNDILERVTS